MLVTELIGRGAVHHRDRIAILFGEEKLSFREVDLLSNRIANVLCGLGLGKGDTAAMLLDNGLHSIPCDFGAIKAGLRRTPLNSRLSLDEHRRMRTRYQPSERDETLPQPGETTITLTREQLRR